MLPVVFPVDDHPAVPVCRTNPRVPHADGGEARGRRRNDGARGTGGPRGGARSGSGGKTPEHALRVPGESDAVCLDQSIPNPGSRTVPLM